MENSWLSFNFCINSLDILNVTEPYSFAACSWLDLRNDQGSVEESRNNNNIRNLPDKGSLINYWSTYKQAYYVPEDTLPHS